jgi:DNA-binding GntR family transcriptional regulator
MNGNYEFLSVAAPLSRTLSDQVADQLREAILLGQLKPGQRIIEQEIAEALALSRGPVRDALKILQNERLIVINPYRGASVAKLTLRDADEIYSLRVVLEVLALHHAIENASDAQIGELNGVIARMVDGLQGGDRLHAHLIDTDLDFHQTLVRISGHSRVASAWAALRGQVSLLMLSHQVFEGLDMSEIAVTWHQQLVSEMLRRNGPAAEETLRKHLARSYEATVLAIRGSGAQPDKA